MKKWAMLWVMSFVLIVLTACAGEDSSDSKKNSNASSAEEPIKLTFAFFTTETTFLGQMVQHWADEVTAKTDGQVEVEIYFGGTLLDATNMFDGVKNKVADMGMTVLQYEPGRYPLVEIAELPIGYPNGKVASQVAHQLIKEYPLESISDLKVVATFSNDANYLFTNKSIEKLTDLKGRQFRVAGAYIPLIEDFGAAGVGMSQAQQAEALQTGIIGGTVTERALLKDAQLAELVDYLIDSPLYISTFTAAMNMDTWNALPENVQKAIEEVGEELPAYAGQFLDERTADNIKWAQDEHGLEIITLSAEEQAKWDAIVKAYAEERIKELEAQGLPAQAYADRALELIEQFSNE